MVSFVCEACQETLKKQKLDQHTYKCRYAQFTCIDCSTTFQGTDYKNHTQCISEAEKYQKSLYKPPKKNQQNNQKNNTNNNNNKSTSSPQKNATATSQPVKSESLIAQIEKKKAQNHLGGAVAAPEPSPLTSNAAFGTSSLSSQKQEEATEKTVVEEENSKSKKKERKSKKNKKSDEEPEEEDLKAAGEQPKSSKKAKTGKEEEGKAAAKAKESNGSSTNDNKTEVDTADDSASSIDFSKAVKFVAKKNSNVNLAKFRMLVAKRVLKNQTSLTKESVLAHLESALKVSMSEDGSSVILSL